MGARVDFKNHIHIASESLENGVLSYTGYHSITPELIERVAADSRVKWVQINQKLPREVYPIIDKFFEKRTDLWFRIFGIFGKDDFDLSVLYDMPHVERVRIEAHLRDNKDGLNVGELCGLKRLKGLHLDMFDRRDYGFMKELSDGLEELVLNIDTMSGSGNFDCEWLLKYPRLRSLWLGKHAKKHIESAAEVPGLRSLTLRGIGIKDFGFLKKAELEKFGLLWCKGSDLSGLGELNTLKELELWRITGLENVDFLAELENLEMIKLQDLKHVERLPDLSRLKRLKKLVLDGVPINEDDLPERIRGIVCGY